MKSLRLTSCFSVFFILFFVHSILAQSLTLENIFYKHSFSSEGINEINSLNDGKSYSSLIVESDGAKIVRTSYETGAILETFVNLDKVEFSAGKKIPSFTYSFSPDESKILFAVLKDRLYRHSTINNYYLYDIKTKTTKQFSGYGMYADFSPDGKNIAYVRDNNIYLVELETFTEKQITTDGVKEKIINGMTDWVYEEEFAINRGFFWSPSGDKIAYYKFDESNVKEFSLTYYEGLYPKEYKYKYPKAGEENSKVKVYLYDLKTGENKQINTTDENDIYIPRIKWTNDNNTLSFQILNRQQNKLDLYFADASTGNSKLIFSHTNKYFLDINNNLTFTGNTGFIWDENNNLYHYDLNGNLLNNISSGKNDEDKFLGYNEKTNRVYYSSSIESPMTRCIFSVNLDGTDRQKISKKTGWNRAEFSSDFSFYVNTYSNITTPEFITVNSETGNEVRVLESNAELQKKITSLNLSKPNFFTYKIPSAVEGTDIDYLNGYMIKPKDFDSTKKYSVMFFNYGGPGSQSVKDEWIGESYFWYEYLAERGIITVVIDNRGTTGRGEAFEKSTYLQLGKYETEDMISAVKYLRTLPYIDKKNIGVYGWSYGGYMAAMCITQAADYFKTAVAVAPVTNWRFYDDIYVERFMRTPQENGDNYDNLSPLLNAKNIKGDFLIIHGMADDNVHLQNTTEMIAEMVKNNIKYDSELYPDKNHGIYGGKTRLHVFTRVTDFFLKSFGK
ncbi:MAG: S9 family peptidase [Bacteroidetes bacterium]|nr:S9 family peptidase [Bacteroidota bacterium]